jgi:N-hydroxyarylamine O-acetyltransferase
MNDFIDLEVYFERINYAGPIAPTLATLRGVQAAHAIAIAFENLDPLLGRPVSLKIPALARKLVDERRGGYCFEQNTLLQAVLRQLGFQVSGLASLVQWNRSDYGPRIHMVLRVELPEGTFFVDVGFGGLTLTSPLRLVPEVEQQTTLEAFRLIPIGPDFQVQVRLGDHWRPVYQVSLQDVGADDYEVYSWFTSTNPDVVFTNHLMAARPADGRRCALSDNVLSIHHLGGRTERRTLTSATELAAVLRDLFLIRLPDGCEPLLDRLTRRNAQS